VQLHHSGDDEVYRAAILLLHDEEFRAPGIKFRLQQFLEATVEERADLCRKCQRPLERVECEVKLSLSGCIARKIVLTMCGAGHVQ
jgi:hypothetical protein